VQLIDVVQESKLQHHNYTSRRLYVYRCGSSKFTAKGRDGRNEDILSAEGYNEMGRQRKILLLFVHVHSVDLTSVVAFLSDEGIEARGDSAALCV
jgi:hypothetical protein